MLEMMVFSHIYKFIFDKKTGAAARRRRVWRKAVLEKPAGSLKISPDGLT
jgi:hypothetical protein